MKAMVVLGEKVRPESRLTPIARAPDYVSPGGVRHVVYLCRCDCGSEVRVRRDHLINGSIISCGCYKTERAKEWMREVGKLRWAKRDGRPQGSPLRK